MTKCIEGLVSFPVDAQRNTFFGALSSILLYRNAYTEETPFFCGKYQRNCIRCGSCKTESFLNKHHFQIYQYLITITGYAYFWIDKEIGNSYDKPYMADEFSETALDRLSLALYASGYRYESMNQNTPENILFDRIKQSVEKNRPVLMKLGLGDLWAVITGMHQNVIGTRWCLCLIIRNAKNYFWKHPIYISVFMTRRGKFGGFWVFRRKLTIVCPTISMNCWINPLPGQN